jgi:peroxiredoxin Q/BCP
MTERLHRIGMQSLPSAINNLQWHQEGRPGGFARHPWRIEALLWFSTPETHKIARDVLGVQWSGNCEPALYKEAWVMTSGAPTVGTMAPDFEATTDSGERVKLSDFRGKRVVLYFYPKDDTPGCTTQACGFRDRYPVIEEKNAVVLGVSPDGQKSHQKFRTKYHLPFTLLVDEDHAIAEAYGVWGQKTFMGKKFMGVVRSHFVIDEEGRIVQAEVNVKPTDSVERALAALSG